MGLWVIIVLVLLGVGLVSLVVGGLWVRARYQTVPSNEALVVTGPKLGDEKKETNIFRDGEGRYMKIIRGGGHPLKFFQTATRVSLSSMLIEMQTPKVYTKEGIGVHATAVATITVSGKLEGIVKYAEQFLGKPREAVVEELNEVLNSNLRAILSELTVEQINGDKQSFNARVRAVAQEQLERMGFEITSLNLKDLKDDEGYLDNLGRPQAARVKREAEIEESQARKETAKKVSEDNESIKLEEYKRQMTVITEKKAKDLLEANNLTETNKAAAQAESAGVLEREERMLEITKKKLEIEEQEKVTDLRLERLERENDVSIEEQQTKVRRQKVDADNYEKREVAKAEAESIRQKSQAEADSIKLKGEAEAEAIKLKAEAMSGNGEIILQELMIKILPEFARASTEYMGNIESLRVWDSGGSQNGGSLKSLLDNPVSTMANIQEQSQQMTGVPLGGLLGKMLGSGELSEVVKDYQLEDKDDSEDESEDDSVKLDF